MSWLLLSIALAQGGAAEATVPATQPQEQVVTPAVKDIRVGHWVNVKGSYLGGGDFRAEKVELLEPGGSEEIVGIVERVIPQRERFWINGQVLRTSSKTEWGGLALSELKGRLVKVKGRYHGPMNFAARDISSREKGRASLEGRVDHIRETTEGHEALVFNVRVLLPTDVVVETAERLERLELAALDHTPAAPNRRFFENQDDAIPGTMWLSDTLRLGALYEVSSIYEDNYNLNREVHKSRRDYFGSVTAELRWQPLPDVSALVRGRGSYRYRIDQDKPDDKLEDLRLSEGWVYWSDILGSGADLQVGRQDFDDRREWLYDQNLDAVRVVWSRGSFRAELSASTTLSDGSDLDRHSENLIAYLSNNDPSRHLAAYVVDRRDGREPKEYPIHFGVRAFGDWLPDNDSWFEYSVLRGYADNVNLEGWALDLGTTWSPSFIGPFYAIAGFAYATGDDPSTQNVDESFRQTGFQDNNDKFGGVTSLSYYGELVNPELSNLGILTLGLGVRPTSDSSVDLIYHDYRLSEAATKLRSTDIDAQMDGVHLGFGREVDLVLGVRHLNGFDLQVTGGYFHPCSALPNSDPAFLVGIRIRYRF
jgi:alginate production protein